MTVTAGQIDFEWRHLRNKLRIRDPARHHGPRHAGGLQRIDQRPDLAGVNVFYPKIKWKIHAAKVATSQAKGVIKSTNCSILRHDTTSCAPR